MRIIGFDKRKFYSEDLKKKEKKHLLFRGNMRYDEQIAF